MRIQFQGIRNQASPPEIAIGVGGTTLSQGGYIFLQCRNRAGVALPSTGVAFALDAGESLTVTVPVDVAEDGEDVQQIFVLYGESATPANYSILGVVDRYDITGALQGLPQTLTFSADEHFAAWASVPNASSLPVDRVHGMRREIVEEATLVEYDADELEWVTAYPQAFEWGVVNALGVDGANRDLGNLGESEGLIVPPYALDGSESVPIGFWLVNDQATAIGQGQKIYIAFETDSGSKSSLLASISGAVIRFGGYVDIATGAIDGLVDGQTMPDLNVPQPYSHVNFHIPLPKDLPSNHAALVYISLSFSVEQVGASILQSEEIRVYPAFGAREGTYIPGGDLIGNVVYADSDVVGDGLRRLLPGVGLTAVAQPGSGMVEEFGFDGAGEELVVGFAADSDDQLVAITGNGHLFVVDPIPANAAQRAIVSTLNVSGPISDWTGPVGLNGSERVEVSVTLPTQIRLDYPDPIAGMAHTPINATSMTVYLRNSAGAIVGFTQPVDLLNVPNVFEVGATSGIPFASLPSPAHPGDGFHLLSPSQIGVTPVPGTALLPAETYEVAIGFNYFNTISRLSHAVADGNIPESLFSLGAVIASLGYWRDPVTDFAQLRQISAPMRLHGQSRLVFSDADGNKAIATFDQGLLDADDDDEIIRPHDIGATEPGRWQVLSLGGGTTREGQKLNLTEDHVITLDDPNVVLLSPNDGGHTITLPSGDEAAYHYIKLLNPTPYPVSVVGPTDPVGEIGGNRSIVGLTAEWIVDEYVITLISDEQHQLRSDVIAQADDTGAPPMYN